MKILNWLLPAKDQNSKVATLLLAARVIFALLLASHGLQKLQGFESLSATFPDPLGIGSQLSLSMAIFGELVCSTAVIFGFLTRLAVIPMAFTMTVAFFITHGGSLAEGELAFAYLVVFVLLFFAGPGKYSIDGLLAGKFLK
ncbi:MAG: DoxX family protein [Prevotella sp.]|nr:DoxX family protein [Prevotella sp.]MDY4039249.1 DoxX family protein [Prevotella sp.]